MDFQVLVVLPSPLFQYPIRLLTRTRTFIQGNGKIHIVADECSPYVRLTSVMPLLIRPYAILFFPCTFLLHNLDLHHCLSSPFISVGTFHAALAAGCPSVVVPIYGDGMYWARAAAALGIGPLTPVSLQYITPELLVQVVLSPPILRIHTHHICLLCVCVCVCDLTLSCRRCSRR